MPPSFQNREGAVSIDGFLSRAGDHVAEVVDDPGLTESRAVALQIADIIADTPAVDTRVLDIHALSTIADFFIICSGDNERQLRAISRDLVEGMSARGVRPIRTEGDPFSGWILLDYGGIIVHVFNVEQRAFYRLDDMWTEAPTLLAIQ